MTSILFYRDDSKVITGFCAQNHAGYAEAGQDIVCAAGSVLVTNFVNSMEALTSDEFDLDVEEAYIRVIFKEKLSKEAKLLLDSLVLGLEAVQEEYPEYMEVIYEEV